MNRNAITNDYRPILHIPLKLPRGNPKVHCLKNRYMKRSIRKKIGNWTFWNLGRERNDKVATVNIRNSNRYRVQQLRCCCSSATLLMFCIYSTRLSPIISTLSRLSSTVLRCIWVAWSGKVDKQESSTAISSRWAPGASNEPSGFPPSLESMTRPDLARIWRG